MKQKLRRTLAWMLTVVMLLGIMPDTSIVSHAEEEVQSTTENMVETIVEEEETEESVSSPEETDTDVSAETLVEEEAPVEEVPEEMTEEVPEEVSTPTETLVTEETPDTEQTTEEVSEVSTESVTDTEQQSAEEETAVDRMLFDLDEDEVPPVVEEEDPNQLTAAEESYLIFHDGAWATNKYRWYVMVNDKKHYIFCLNHGMTMRNATYTGLVTTGYSGKSAFKKAAALNYFYQANGNSWSGNKEYGPVQEVIWDEAGSDTAKKLTTYIDHAWKVTSLNPDRTSGTGSYSSKLKGIKKSEQETADARKEMIAQLTGGKHIIDMSDTYDVNKKTLNGTIELSGTAWKYFNKGGFNGGSSDIVVDGIYDTDGKKADGSTASIDNSGNLVVDIKTAEGMGNNKKNAYTIIMHINLDYKGANSIDYLLTADGKQNLTYDAQFNSAAYFAVKVWGKKENQENAKLYINKVDEFGTFVPGCEFELTGVEGDALQMEPKNLVVNGEAYYFDIEYPGYYKLVETAVPSSEYQIDPTAHYVYAQRNAEGKLLLYEAYLTDSGYRFVGDNSMVGGMESSKHQGSGTMSFKYYFENKYNSGAATLVKNANVLVRYENGKFVYEKRTLDNVGFTFFAAEDIYLGETVIFHKDEEIYSGTNWGNFYKPAAGAPQYDHEVVIDGKLVKLDQVFMPTMEKYRGYTANGGKMTISDLPSGSYYCVESDLSHPGLVMAVGRFDFDIVAGQTATINGADGILNEQAPADALVYKKDGYSKEYLAGAEFTIYASINNTNYDGVKLFNANQTVDVVVERNLGTGEEIVESATWIPIQSAVSNAEGRAMFENLPYGEYLVAETKAPEGYELSEKTIKFTHSLPDGTTDYSSGFTYEHEIENIVTSHFSIYKEAEKEYSNPDDSKNAYIYKEEPVEGAVFGVYAAEEIKNTLGKVAFSQDELITTCTTDKDGIAQFSGAFFAGKYYYQELQTPDDEVYKLDPEKYTFEVTGKEKTKVLTDEAIMNEQYKGSIKVIKTDGKTKVALPGVEFNLLDSAKKIIGTYVTDEKGEILIQNLPVGTYYLQESKTKENYILSEDAVTVTISKDNLDHTVAITNDEYKGSIKVIKTDGETTVALQGVEFNLLDADKKVINTYVTDEKGEILISNLSLGTYYLQESKTLKNYILDDTMREVKISKEHLNQVVNITNERYKGSIKVIKTDGKTKVALSGIEFDLLDADKNVIGHYVTDKKGEILIEDLELGTYYLQETKTKKGYKLNDDLIEVEISAEDLHKLVKIVNDRNETRITIKTDSTYSGSGGVRTGDTSPIGLILSLFFMSIIGFAFCMTRMIKLQTKPIALRTKKFMVLVLALSGVIAVGTLTVKAAEEFKELKNVEYKGTKYKYALQKQYETSNQEEKITFEDEVDGMKLVDVEYQLLETIDGESEEQETLKEQRDYKDLLEKDESKVDETITIEGNVYKLQDITWSEVPNMETVNYTVDYGYQTAEPTPGATYEYTYTSPVTKKDNTVTLPLVRLEKGDETWVDGFTATVTFHNLDGKYFTLGNHEFEYNPTQISLKDSDYKVLVKMLGYDTSKYRLTNISWSGEEYKKDGEKCRDAKAIGQQYAASYKAYYEDEVENGKIYTAHATYVYEAEVLETEPIYVMQATAYYKEASSWTNILTFVTEHKAISVVFVGLLLLIILVILYMMRKSKRTVAQVEDTE